MSNWTVLKFGGSSLKDETRQERVARVIARQSKHGRTAVVVSAPGKTTDRLVRAMTLAESNQLEDSLEVVDELSAWLLTEFGSFTASTVEVIEGLLGRLTEVLKGVALLGELTQRTSDEILSFGERLSVLMVADRLQGQGVAALAVDARQWLATDDHFGEAAVDWDRTSAQLGEVREEWKGRVPVVTGFIGREPSGRTTTLGREGSDYTAALLARGLGAARLEIWTDVSGVFTADPNVVPEARALSHLTYGEALELSVFGARVLHARTMIPLIEADIPLYIRNTLRPTDPGTRVDAVGNPDVTRATSVTSLDNLALLDLRLREVNYGSDISRRVHAAIGSVTSRVWLSTHAAHGQSVSVVVPVEEAEAAVEALEAVLLPEREAGVLAPIDVQQPVGVVTLVAEAMGRTPNVAGRFFGSLGTVGINVLSAGQSASARSISAVIRQEALATAIRSVHDAFNLDSQAVSVSLLGRGLVGSALIHQLQAQKADLISRHGLDVRLVSLADSQGRWTDGEGLDVQALPEQSPEDLEAHLQWLATQPTPVLVDCTAADGMDEVHRRALEVGIHVVTANKKPLAQSYETWRQLHDTASASFRAYRFETTVGAALPVVETLQGLVQTGDTVERVEGSLSGTLGFVVNRLSEGVLLHDAVKEAQERGYTEPFPGEDLSGQDVLRKALILARSAGIAIEPEDVELTPLVPTELLAPGPLDGFYKGLEGYAQEMSQQLARLEAAGQVLRYLAVLSLEGKPRLRVGPTAVSSEHPAARLRGAEAFVAFTTERYKVWPLLIQGPGAGGDVTASGVLTDVLRIALGLRGARSREFAAEPAATDEAVAK